MANQFSRRVTRPLNKGKNILFNKCWDTQLLTSNRMKLNFYLTSYVTINSKWIKDLNVRAKTIKLLEENISANLHDLSLGKSFYTSNQTNKKDFMKIKNFCASRDLIRQSKDNPQNGRKS